MPRVSTEQNTEYWDPQSAGPVMQMDLSKKWASGGLPMAPIAAGTTFDSGLQYADGFKSVALGVLMDQAGTISLQRYLDEAGLIPQGAAIQAAVTANTPAVVNAADNLPFVSVRARIANSGGSAANVSAVALLFNAS